MVALCAAGEIASRTRPNSIRQVRSRLPRVTRCTRQALQRGMLQPPYLHLNMQSLRGSRQSIRNFKVKLAKELTFTFYKIPIAKVCRFHAKRENYSNF